MQVATKLEISVQDAKKHIDHYLLEVEQHILELQNVDSAAGSAFAKLRALGLTMVVTVLTTLLM